MKKIITILAALVISANSFAQAPNCLWANSSGGAGDDVGQSVATDAHGNVYVTGYFKSATMTFGTTTLTNADNTGNSNDIFVAKYDAAGTLLWAKLAGGSGNDYCNSITTDASGNVYVTGYFPSPTISFGTTTLSNVDNTGNTWDVFVVKYDATGNVLWAKRAGGNGGEVSTSIVTDASGNVYVTGFFTSASTTFGAITLTNANNLGMFWDILFVKYAPNGTVLWAKSAGGTSDDYVTSVASDVSGNVYVTGYFQSTTITFGSTTLNNAGFRDIFIVKYDTSGTVLWAKSAGVTVDDMGLSVSTDASGNIYVTGAFQSPTITFGTTTLTNADNTGNSWDMFVVKYEATGNVLWAKRAGVTGNDYGTCVATDASGNVYVTGSFDSPTITFGTNTLTNVGYEDIFIAKYDAAGTVLWATSSGSTTYDRAYSIATDTIGNAYVTGCFDSPTITFGTNIITNAGIGQDMFIAKYEGTGTGVDELFGIKDLSVSPNPATTAITLTIPKLINANITITNLTGKQVATYNLQNTSTKTIDISQLAEGLYFVSLQSDEGVVTKKMIKTN